MSDIPNRPYVFVKERVGMFKAANAYDLFDEHENPIGKVEEDIPNAFVKMLKFTGMKPMLPFRVHFYDADGKVYMTLRRKFTIGRSMVFLDDEDGRTIGQYKQKLFAFKPKFWILSPEGQEIGEVQGDWKGWDFTVIDKDQQPVGKVTKKWAGIGKELFTTADNYVIAAEQGVSVEPDFRKLAFAAGICIDMVLKEQNK
ncbi:MAG: RNAase [Deltaproteobacteria bacterium]|nr:RNAase [Deltaproteobacteria bacterium]